MMSATRSRGPARAPDHAHRPARATLQNRLTSWAELAAAVSVSAVAVIKALR